MCRWLAYSGSPILLKEALFTPAHSLIDQSLHSPLGAEPTNGDGFGVGRDDDAETPGVFRSIEPAWNDQNLRELAGHMRRRISSPTFARRSAAGAADQLPPVPPRNWLFMHNGYIGELSAIKRDLVLAIDPSLYPPIQGRTDTEVLFYLALTSASRTTR